MKNCREKIKSVLSLGVLLKDDTTSDKSVIGDVFLKAHGVKRQPIRHSTGYFLFMDLPKGKYQLTAGGTFYRLENYPINMDSINPKEPFIELFLKQKTSYLLYGEGNIVKDKKYSENKPSADASIKIKGKNKESNSIGNKIKREKRG